MEFQISQPSTGTLSTVIVERIADSEGVDPLDLPPLFETIDTEHLTKLHESQSGDAELSLSFTYAGYTIYIHHDGTLEIVPKELTSAGRA